MSGWLKRRAEEAASELADMTNLRVSAATSDVAATIELVAREFAELALTKSILSPYCYKQALAEADKET